jgi:branched-chain amino acid transport system permease protein
MKKLFHVLIRISPIAGAALFFATLPLYLNNPYVLRIFIHIGIYALLTSSLNIVNGYTGLFSVGHAAFYGVGAYASTILCIRLGLSFWLGLPFGAFAAGVAGYVIAKPTLRLRGVFLTLTTMGFNMIIMLIFLNWDSLTGGSLGIMGIPMPVFFNMKFLQPLPYYYLIIIINFIVIIFLYRLMRSRFGLTLKAIREDERAAACNGINVARWKNTAFVLAAVLAGLAGAFYAHYIRYISPEAFNFTESFIIVTMLAFGGPGNILGPVVGAFILVGVTEAFRVFADYRMVFYGTLLILMMLVRPQGLLGGREYPLTITWPPVKKTVYRRGDRFLDDPAGEENNEPAQG